MNSFYRLIPYVWPHRRRLYFSVLFALLVAVLWAVSLTLAFPVVKVLLQGQTLTEYVEGEIRTSEEEIAGRTAQLDQLDREQQALEARGVGPGSSTLLEIRKDQARYREKLSKASWNLMLMSWVRRSVVPYVPRDQFDTLAVIMLILLVASILKGICIVVQETLIGSVVELSILGLRKAMLRHALKLDYQTLSLQGTPELMSRFTYDANFVALGLNLLGGKIIREPLKAAACVGCAFYVNWQLTLLSLLCVPAAAVVFRRFGIRLKQASHRLMESMSRMYKVLEETFDGSKAVIAFGMARRHRRKFHLENKEYYSKAMRIIRIDSLTNPSTEVLGMIAVALGLMPGAYLVLRGTTSIWGIKLSPGPMDIATLSLLYTLLAGVIDPARKLSSVYTKIKHAGAAADRVFTLMDTEPIVKEPARPKPLPRLSRSVEFERVTFTYATKSGDDAAVRPPALQDVSLSVAAGETVAIVGENGCGKSTLVNLLPRFYDPDRGSVLIDGVDLREASLREVRAQMSVVSQETQLFDESILDNIRYGRPDATFEEIEEAARQAHVLQFTAELPDGLETRVGEKGRRLSGGQRQRVALARAMLRDPSVLILDEATSAIDAQSEFLIHQALCEFTRGRTTFLITHAVSQSLLEFVTKIVVMERGRIVSIGSHETLIGSCPLYQRLFQSQVHQRSA